MVDPLTLSALGGAVLSQGVAFLYNQAGELLKRRRERRDQDQPDEPRRIESEPLEGELAPVVADDEALKHVAVEMAELRRRLSDYVDDIQEISPDDSELLATVDALRCLLEVVYRQRITFRGEPSRVASGSDVAGFIDVTEVLGKAVAVRVKNVSGSTRVSGEAKASRVESNAELIGVEIDRIDGR